MKEKKNKTMLVTGPGGIEYEVPIVTQEEKEAASQPPLFKVQGGKGMVMPAGSVPPVASLAPGKHKLEIVDVHKGHLPTGEDGLPVPQTAEVLKAREESPYSYVEVKYPDGYVREHHTTGLPDLLEKIVSNLRARYGCEGVSILEAKTLGVGAIISVEV